MTMKELISISKNQDGIPAVSGRELHEVLQVDTRYSIWFNRMIEYGFEENKDFEAIDQKRTTAQGNETTFVDHALSLDMAKHIAMIQRTDKGKEVRQFFIEAEKGLRAISTLSLASVHQLEDVIEYLKDEVHLLKQQRSAFHAKEGSLPLQFAVKKLRDLGIWKGNEYELVNWMILNRIIQRHKTKRQHFVVYQKYFNKGYFDWGTLETNEPTPLLKSEIFITAKGLNWLTEMFAALTQKRDEPLLEYSNQQRNQRLPRELTVANQN